MIGWWWWLFFPSAASLVMLSTTQGALRCTLLRAQRPLPTARQGKGLGLTPSKYARSCKYWV